jgi:GT2 family glycosyltransferase
MFLEIDEAGIHRLEEQLDCIAGSSLFVFEPFIWNIGLMEERYFLYYEELDWAIRSKGCFGLGYASKAMVCHKQRVTTYRLEQR